MTQLAIEFVRDEYNLRILYSYGFRLSKGGWSYNLHNEDYIHVFNDNSINVSINYGQTLSLLLNLLEANVFKIIEE